MVTTIDDVFTTMFEREVFHEFQRMGSAFRNTVRTKNKVKGSSTKFVKVGKGVAGSKTRHGQVPIMNAGRSFVTCTMQDRYAGEYIDKLDELKVEHDERQVAGQTVAYAMGRDVDNIILTAMVATTNSNNNTTAATWSAAATPLTYVEAMGKADVPFDGNLFSAVCWQAWIDLLDIDEFSNQDYVPGDRLWFKGVVAKEWAGVNWFPFSGLPLDGSNDAKQPMWHRTAVGHGLAQDFSLDVTWQGKEQAHLAVGSMSHGACLADEAGVLYNVYDITP